MTNNQINYAKLKEERRHNLATEDIQYTSTDIQRDQTAENIRHNMAVEATGWYNADTQRAQQEGQVQRWTSQSTVEGLQADASALQARAANMNAAANMQNAQTRRSELTERIRHDFADEDLRAMATKLVNEVDRLKLDELERNNLAMEAIADFKAQTERGRSYTQSFNDIMQGIDHAAHAGTSVVETYLKYRGRWYNRPSED